MDGTASSRTPEGSPGHCPICGTAVRIESSQIAGDASCPSCGALLWFVKTTTGVHLYDAREVKSVFERIIAAPADGDMDVSRLMTGKIDSVEVVQLVMAAEDSAGLNITDEDAGQIQSPGDAIHYLITRLLKNGPAQS
ncbi:MAG TPA: hypothetical protein VG269_17085 [Tepidisphaeraceae bacterium]|jgi:acyl carrier protein|nr:hypothetical protein [Tepidisphaeraceae bacterium]